MYIPKNSFHIAGRHPRKLDWMVMRGNTVWDLVVVIVSWNVRDMVVQCLRSLFQAPSTCKVKIVLFDNASTDDTVRVVAEQFPAVEVIPNGRNEGFAKGNNRVLERYQEKARYFFLLNPDTEVEPCTIDKMVDYMDKQPDVGIVGCKLVRPTGVLDWPCKRSLLTPSAFFYRAVRLDSAYPQSKRFGRYHLTYLDEDSIHEVDAVSGAALMIRWEALQEVGMLDETFFAYGEDLDWCYRVRAAEWKIHYAPITTVVHHKSQSSSKRGAKIIYWWHKALWIVYKRHVASRHNGLLNGAVWCGLTFMCCISLARNLLRHRTRLPSR